MKYFEWIKLSEAEKRREILTASNGKAIRSGNVLNSMDAFERFIVLAMCKKKKGFTHYSARTIIHVIRFETDVVDGDIHFKINDHLSSDFARLSMLIFSELDDFFELRGSK